MLRIYLFGSPEFVLDNRQLPQLSQSPILTKLIAFLATHAGQPVARSVLAALFWPDLPEFLARKYLNTHLCRLRHTLKFAGSASFLLSNRESIELDNGAACWLDIAEFEQGAAILATLGPQGRYSKPQALAILETVVGLYRGDFLEGIYDDWCLTLREQLRQQYLALLEALGRNYIVDGHYRAAQNAFLRLVNEDPTCENAHVQLIQLQLLLGLRSDAFKQYERYCDIWHAELGMGPSARMQALVQRLKDETACIDGQLSLPVSPNQEKRIIEQLFGALESSPDALANGYSKRLHTLLWPIVADHCERLAQVLKADDSSVEANRCFGLARQINAWMKEPAP